MNVIITGATGMVGEGVLFECLENQSVRKILIVSRKHYPLKHPKVEELLIADFSNLKSVSDKLTGYDACFYCAGISSVGVNEEQFTKITFDTTLAFAKQILELNPKIVFNFVSGNRTDSTEQGKVMWARIKGKTENALMKLPFKAQYNFRPAIMKGTKGQINVKRSYKILAPLIAPFFPQKTLTLKEVGRAMINAVLKGYPKPVLEVDDIAHLAKAH